MGCFTPYENFKTLTTNDLQFHSPIRFNQSGPGMPVSKPSTHTPTRLAYSLSYSGRCRLFPAPSTLHPITPPSAASNRGR